MGRSSYHHGVLVRAVRHPAVCQNGYIQESRLIAERAMGKHLPRKAVIHHIDKDVWNNANCNLVVCEDQSYHNLIHRRERAFRATGNPDAQICGVCKKYDDVSNLKSYVYLKPYGRRTHLGHYHPKCHSERQRKRYHNNKLKRQDPELAEWERRQGD